jgi:ribosomal protein S18 acetylase RimI-like enzyme
MTGAPGTVRRAAVEDLPGIVEIHQKAFRDFFLTRLGDQFLRRYYGVALHYQRGIVLVSDGAGALEGFACGFVDPVEFYRLMWRNRSAFAAPALSTIVRHPSLLSNVLRGLVRVQNASHRSPERSCELASIAVTPEAAGRGLGKALLRAFLERARCMDAQSVYLTTDADGNEPANEFYQRAGFQKTRRFLQGQGRWMNEYAIRWEGTLT